MVVSPSQAMAPILSTTPFVRVVDDASCESGGGKEVRVFWNDGWDDLWLGDDHHV